MDIRKKYGNKKIKVDGIEFDSQLEANRYYQLKILSRRPSGLRKTIN